MKFFDREQERNILRADHGVAMMLREPLDEARARRSVTSWGISCFNQLVRAALCELDQEGGLLLERALSWLDVAVRESERASWSFGKLWTEAERFNVLGLCHWLKDRNTEHDHFSSACETLRRYFRREKSKIEVTYQLPTFLLAGRYDELLARFRACEGLEPPSSLRGVKCPGKMSYLFAMHELHGDPDRASLEQAFQSFLKFMIPVCLHLRSGGFGVETQIPAWTLLDERYFSRPTANGFENIRRALAYLPTESAKPASGQAAAQPGTLDDITLL